MSPSAQISRCKPAGRLISWKALGEQKGHGERRGGGEQTGGGRNAIKGGEEEREEGNKSLNNASGSEDVDYHDCVVEGNKMST